MMTVTTTRSQYLTASKIYRQALAIVDAAHSINDADLIDKAFDVLDYAETRMFELGLSHDVVIHVMESVLYVRNTRNGFLRS